VELTTVQLGKPGRNGFAVPPAEEAPRKLETVPLDMKIVKAKLEETAEVSAILSKVFSEESPSPPARTCRDSDDGNGPLDPSQPPLRFRAPLDRAHSELLRMLCAMGQTSRDDFEKMARSLKLLPNGALDRINDAGFELYESTVCEGEDPIRVNAEVAKEMLNERE